MPCQIEMFLPRVDDLVQLIIAGKLYTGRVIETRGDEVRVKWSCGTKCWIEARELERLTD